MPNEHTEVINFIYDPDEDTLVFRGTMWRVHEDDYGLRNTLIDSNNKSVVCYCSLSDIADFLALHGQEKTLRDLPVEQLKELMSKRADEYEDLMGIDKETVS